MHRGCRVTVMHRGCRVTVRHRATWRDTGGHGRAARHVGTQPSHKVHKGMSAQP